MNKPTTHTYTTPSGVTFIRKSKTRRYVACLVATATKASYAAEKRYSSPAWFAKKATKPGEQKVLSWHLTVDAANTCTSYMAKDCVTLGFVLTVATDFAVS